MTGGTSSIYLPDGQKVNLPTTPRTWADAATGVPGEWLRAKWLEADVGAAVAWHRQKPLFQGINTAVTAVASSTWTPMPLIEIIDNYQGHADGTNTSRWYAPSTSNTTDWYLATGYIPLASVNAANVHVAGLQVDSAGTVFEGTKLTSGTGHYIDPMVVDLIPMTADGTHYLEVAAWQNTGASVNTIAASRTPSLTVRWVCSGAGTTVALPATPHTWAGTDVVTAAATGGAKVPLNTNVRDVVRWLNYPPIARVTSAGTAQTIPTGAGTWTSIQMPTKTVDNYGMWSSGANTLFTCQRAGMYLIVGQGAVTETAANTGYRAVRLLQTLAAGGTAVFNGGSVTPASTATTGTALIAAHHIRMAVGDTIETQFSHNQGAALSVKTGAGDCSKMIAVWESL